MASVRIEKRTLRRGGRRAQKAKPSPKLPPVRQREGGYWYGKGPNGEERGTRHRIIVCGPTGEETYLYDVGVWAGSTEAFHPDDWLYGEQIELPAAVIQRLAILDSRDQLIDRLVNIGGHAQMFEALIDRALKNKNYQRAADLQRLLGESTR